MKKLKLVIVSIHIKNSPQGMPLAAGMLGAELDSLPEIRSRLDVSFADFYLENTAEEIAESICGEMPDIIGFSVYLWNRDLTARICHIIKNRFSDIKLAAGGAEATTLPERLLKDAPFDFVIQGEGEFAFAEVIKRILENRPYDDIAGVYVKNKVIREEKNQWPVEELDCLPSPFLTGVIDLKKYSGVLWELSRGCPFKCSFCFESRGVAGVRQFSLERVQKELELFESEKVTQVFVLDPTFNRDVKRAKKILHMIRKTAPLMHFTFEVRTEFIDNEMAELFSMINCSLQIGLQSAHPEVLVNVNRKIDQEQYAAKISMLNSAGVVFGLDLIYGLPGDTLDGFRSSLDYALQLQPNHLDIFPLAVLPGTVLYEEAVLFNLDFIDEAPYTLISSPGFSKPDMEKSGSLKEACNIFYNRGGAAGWMFMVYETLGIAPSDVIYDFDEYLASNNLNRELDSDRITEVQTAFVEKLFLKHNAAKLYPVMKDIIIIHGAMNCSLYAGPFAGEIKTSFTEGTLFKLSAGTKIIGLQYSFNDLMNVGEFTIEEFLINFRKEKTSVIIYNCRGEVKSLIVGKYLSKLVQSLTCGASLQSILKNNTSVARDEIYEFVEYAVSETIISAE